MSPHKWLWLPVFGIGTLATAQNTQDPSRESAPASFFWSDYDSDGLADAFVVTPSGDGRLLWNRGDGTFEDVTGVAGLAGAAGVRFALWEDVDRDADPDLLIGTSAGSRFFHNQGGTFADATAASGLVHAEEALDAGFFDFDRDGLRDLHLRTAQESLLFRNAGEGLFTPVELELPIASGNSPSNAVSPPKSVANETSPKSGVPDDSSGKVEHSRSAPVDTNGLRVAVGGLPPGGSADATALPWCALALRDQGAPGCLYASSIPTLGKLYPISSDLFVAPNGSVGLGTTSPQAKLEVNGTTRLDDDLRFQDGSDTLVFPAVSAPGSPMIEMFASGSANADRMVIAHSSAVPSWGLEYEDNGDRFVFQKSAGTPVFTVDLNASRTFVNRKTEITPTEYFGVTAPVTLGYGGMYVDTAGASAWPFYGYAAGGLAKAWTYLESSTQKWHLNNGGNRLTVQPDGKVGIANSSPATTLDVAGTTRTDSLQIDLGSSQVDLEAFLGIGVANAMLVPCILEGPRDLGWDGTSIERGGLTMTVVDDEYMTFALPLPTNRGGLKLYVLGAYVGIEDADSQNLVLSLEVIGVSESARTVLQTLGGWSSPGTQGGIFTALNVGSYDRVVVSLGLFEGIGGGDLRVNWVQLRCYYAP